ncbi:retrovirus-related pol polyprotein from transposon TNT 1-94 [Tanacetum coccineum]
MKSSLPSKYLRVLTCPPTVYDSEETLQLAQESRLKMKQLNKEIKPANYTKINHLSGVFVSQTAKSQEEVYFSNTSKTANVSKSFSIPNEEFSDDTTPSVARKFLNEVKSTIVTLQRVVKQKMTLDIHNWSSSAHQEIHKIVKDEIFPIVNQVDTRVQNFEIQFLKEAAKFVRDFKSLAKEADESLAKHKALELEIKRLLRAVVSQDIMSIVQNPSVVDSSNLQTELERTKERFENYIIKKENEYAKLWNDWYKKCEECKYDKISYDKAYNDMQQKIKRLQAQLGDQKGKSKDTPCVSNTLDPLSQKLENGNVELEFQVRNYEKENAHLKTTYKNLFDSISVTLAQTKTIIDSLQDKLHDSIYENAKLIAQLFDKDSEQKDTTKGTSVNTQFCKQSILGKPPSSSKPKLYDVTPFLKSKGLPKIDKTRALSKPVTSTREEKYVPNKVRASVRTNPIIVSQPHIITKKDVNFDLKGLSSTRVDNTAKTRRPQPRSNTKNDRVPSASKSSCNKNKEVEVEEHHRNLLLSKNKKHMSSECKHVKLDTRNDQSEVICAMCKQCLITANHDVCVLNYVNDMNSHGEKQKANVSNTENQKKQKLKVMKPKKVGSNERLASPKPSKPRSYLSSNGDNACTLTLQNYNQRFSKFHFFSWQKFLGTVRFGNYHVAAILGFGDLQWGNILITGVYFIEGLGHNLFSVEQFYDSDLEVAFRRNTCFVRNLEGVDLLKGNRTTNLYTINLLEMASASPICLMARATSNKSWLWHQRLSHLNFDTINDLAKNDLVTGLPKFKYHKEYLCPSCEQGKSKRASPNQFQFLSRVEAARTILILSRAPLFLWAEAIATACYTQNRSIIHRRFNKTPYELINGKKLDIFFLHVFGALCYPKNDREDIRKLGEKGDIGFFIGYSADSCAYRVYNRRTKKIMETMNVTFDELSAMAFEQSSMYDDHISGQPLAAPRTVPAAQAPQVLQTPTVITTTSDTAPTPTNSSSQATNFLNTSQDVDELETQQLVQHQPATIANNVLNAMFDENTFVNPFATLSTSAAESSSSQYVDPSNMHTFYQPYPHEYQWTKITL